MPLTPEQQQALNNLLARVSRGARPAQTPDVLKTWLGLSSGELKAQLAALLDRKQSAEQQLLALVERNPLDAAIAFLAAASAAFYAAEKDANPKIKTYIDAFYYIATCASVGYADIFAITQPGRAIAAFVMIVGPALAARSLDRPHATEDPIAK
ncbi:MAG TPA: ion channel [Anaerolineae bacterium]|nr:ion channel [Anaerolineae bacterium]